MKTYEGEWKICYTGTQHFIKKKNGNAVCGEEANILDAETIKKYFGLIPRPHCKKCMRLIGEKME